MEDISKIYVNGKSLDFRFIGNFNKMLYLGKFDVGEYVKVEFESNADELTFDEEYLYYEDEKILKECYDILSNEQMNLKQISQREYEGKIGIQEDNEYVVLSIPYDEGWSITVDGIDKQIFKVQDGLMAVEVPKGEHIVRIKYLPTGFIMGACLSAYGVVILLINVFLYRKRNIT